ncbi:hypothetical protein D3C77_618130 [compost metagenome]|uniref:hemin uptake protein HemP n=1 Tax=Stutzerimonas stutzeri TaxID=316 RepID=UPI000FB8CC40|nr:hemin uptake protein HemP [Stutzerimonas stutzeri]
MSKPSDIIYSKRALSDPGQAQQTGSAPPRPRVSSNELLGGSKELVIVHDGREYVLRLTRQDKLILTK